MQVSHGAGAQLPVVSQSLRQLPEVEDFLDGVRSHFRGQAELFRKLEGALSCFPALHEALSSLFKDPTPQTLPYRLQYLKVIIDQLNDSRELIDRDDLIEALPKLFETCEGRWDQPPLHPDLLKAAMGARAEGPEILKLAENLKVGFSCVALIYESEEVRGLLIKAFADHELYDDYFMRYFLIAEKFVSLYSSVNAESLEILEALLMRLRQLDPGFLTCTLKILEEAQYSYKVLFPDCDFVHSVLASVSHDTLGGFAHEFIHVRYEELLLSNIPHRAKKNHRSLLTHLQSLKKCFISHDHHHASSGTQASQIPVPYVLEKLIAEVKLAIILGKYHPSGTFPYQDVFRFAIDGFREKDGSYIFDEDEPGFILAYYKSMLLAFKSGKSRPFDFEFYQDLRKAAIANVFTFKLHDAESGSDEMEPLPEMMGVNGRYTIANMLDQDPDGLDDCLKCSGASQSAQPHCLPYSYTSYKKLIRSIATVDQIQRAAPLYFKAMHEYIDIDPGNVAQRLIAYLWLVREMSKRHIFADANSRSANIALLNRIAQDDQLPMILFHESRILDPNSLEKTCYRAIEGMMNFIDCGRNSFTTDHRPKLLKDLDLSADRYASLRDLRDALVKEIDGQKWEAIHWEMFPDTGLY